MKSVQKQKNKTFISIYVLLSHRAVINGCVRKSNGIYRQTLVDIQNVQCYSHTTDFLMQRRSWRIIPICVPLKLLEYILPHQFSFQWHSLLSLQFTLYIFFRLILVWYGQLISKSVCAAPASTRGKNKLISYCH